MKNLLSKFLIIVLTISVILPVLAPSKTSAVSASDWQAGRIIDDSVFYNPNTMSTQDIQNFLNVKGQYCNSNCLKNYSTTTPAIAADAYCNTIGSSSKSAATIIKEISAACRINPQVLIVLMQKEQSIVTSTSTSSYAYQFATGFCVYDSVAPPQCADTDGFFRQVYYAARQFQKYLLLPQSFGYKAGITANIQYSPNAGCGSSSVYIQNSATAALYNYTPYQPNQGALNAGWGEASCGAYGNRNFWLYFWSWFGSPNGSEYAWSIENFSYSSGDNIITAGNTETLTLKARNIGRQPWYNHGDHPVRLGTWSPENRSSSVLPIRPAGLQESVVQINEIGTFQFQISPTNIGTFVEPLNLVVENYKWMDWPGFSPTIVSTNNPYQWRVDRVVYGNGTGVMDPSSSQSFVVWATNTGNVTWNKSSSPPVWLATWPPDRGSAVSRTGGGKWPNNRRITQFNESSVAPGGQASFQFDVTVPTGGNYYEQLNLVAEGQNWFNDANLTLYLHGRTNAWQPEWTSLSTGNNNIGRNQTFDITVRAKNTGELTWTRSGSYPVRLGTSSPVNRGSGLYYSPSWLSDVRPASLVESSVSPGGFGTFTFTARTPSTPGPRIERFNLVAEGLEWLNDPGLNVYINVL